MINYKEYLNVQLADPEFLEEWENTEIEYRIARNIILQRKKLNLTQKELAEKTGIKQSAISRVESGNQNTTIKTLALIADGLEISVSDLTKNRELEEVY